MPARLKGMPGLIGAAALILFVGTGAYAYYNTNVLNPYAARSITTSSRKSGKEVSEI
jgi:hypothetical protein